MKIEKGPKRKKRVMMTTTMMMMTVTMARTIVRMSTRISTRRVHTMRGVRFPLNQLL